MFRTLAGFEQSFSCQIVQRYQIEVVVGRILVSWTWEFYEGEIGQHFPSPSGIHKPPGRDESHPG